MNVMKKPYDADRLNEFIKSHEKSKGRLPYGGPRGGLNKLLNLLFECYPSEEDEQQD